MARRYLALEDLTSEGLREDVAPTAKLWKTLENVRRGDGGWQKRPGINRIDTGSPPAADGQNLPKQIITYKHPESIAQSEIIRPNSAGNYDQWTKQSGVANWTNINEVTANDDTDYIEEATLGEQTSFGFSDLTGTWNNVTSIRISIRAKRVADTNHTLTVRTRIGGTDYDFGSGSVFVKKGTGWVNLSIDSSTNPATKLPWTPAAVDALEIILKKGTGLEAKTETKSYTENSSGKPLPLSVFGSVRPTRQDFNNIASSETWSGTPAPTVKLTFTDNGSGSRPGVSFVSEGAGQTVRTSPSTVSAPGIPVTGTAFAFAVQRRASSTNVSLTALDLIRTGKLGSDSKTLRVTQVFASIEGDGVVSRRNSLIMLTSGTFLRIAEDLSSYADIKGTASASTASAGAVWDNAIFINTLYITNGKDQLFTFPTSDAFAQLSGAPTGKAIASFASRLCLGDVTESSNRSPHQFRWSAINDGANWTDASSGNLELDDTAGKIMKLKPLVEPSESLVGVLVAYKTEGIYHISATGTPSSPFERKLMDASSGCLARGSVVGISTPEGEASHVFLGQVGGTVNVMSWDGRNIRQFGFEIVPILNSIGDIVNLEKSIAIIDSFGNYILMFPTTDSSFLKTALVYNFNKKVWTVWTLGNTTALGTWTRNSGRPITVLGRPDEFAYYFDDALSSDDTEGEDAVPYTATWETGDLGLLAPEIWRSSTLQRMWLYYQEDSSASVLTVDASIDGGVNRTVDEDTTSAPYVLTGDSGTQLVRMDFRLTGRKHSFRMQQTADDGKPQMLQLIFEMEEGGIESP